MPREGSLVHHSGAGMFCTLRHGRSGCGVRGSMKASYISLVAMSLNTVVF